MGKEAEKPKKSKALKDTKPPPLPEYVTGKRRAEKGIQENDLSALSNALSTPSPKKGELTVKEMMDNVHRMQAELEKKLDQVYEVTGWTPEYLSSYLSNPNNFNEKDWEWMNQERKALREKFQPNLEGVPDFVLKKLSFVPKKEVKNSKGAGSKKKSKGDEKIHKKTAGIRRNWIPMK